MKISTATAIFWATMAGVALWVLFFWGVNKVIAADVVIDADGSTSAELAWDHSGTTEPPDEEPIDGFRVWKESDPSTKLEIHPSARQVGVQELQLEPGSDSLIVSAYKGDDEAVSDPLEVNVVLASSLPLSATADATPASGDAPLAVQFTGIAQGGGTPPTLTMDESLFVNYTESQDGTGTLVVSPDGKTVTITGNDWMAYPLATTITPETVLEVTFASSALGEIHAIALEDQTETLRTARFFQFYGSQTDTGNLPPTQKAFYTYQPPNPASYIIPIGQYYTGAVTHIVFAMDHDVSGASGESIFSDIRVYTPGTVEYTYSWDLGNGCTSSTQNPTSNYFCPGTYTATLTVSDGVGTATDSVDITVNPSPLQCQ